MRVQRRKMGTSWLSRQPSQVMPTPRRPLNSALPTGLLMNTPALFTKHRPIALAIAREWHIPGGNDDDVRQEALIALWEAARNHDPDRGPFPPHARAVIRSRLRDKLRDSRRHQQLVLTEAVRDWDAPTNADTHQRLEERDHVRHLTQRITQLPLFERKCLIGVVFEGRTYKQLGNRKQVDNALQNARRKLRQAA